MTAQTMINYTVNVKGIQYTGSNAQDVMDTIDLILSPFVSTLNGGVITTFLGPMNPGDWFCQDYNLVSSIVPNSRFVQHLYAQGDLDTISLGIAAVPTLLGSTQTTVQVTIKPAFADTNYQATAVVTGAVNLLASLSVLSVSVINTSRVDVVVRNTGLLSLSGASVLVSCIHN